MSAQIIPPSEAKSPTKRYWELPISTFREKTVLHLTIIDRLEDNSRLFKKAFLSKKEQPDNISSGFLIK